MRCCMAQCGSILYYEMIIVAWRVHDFVIILRYYSKFFAGLAKRYPHNSFSISGRYEVVDMLAV